MAFLLFGKFRCSGYKARAAIFHAGSVHGGASGEDRGKSSGRIFDWRQAQPD